MIRKPSLWTLALALGLALPAAAAVPMGALTVADFARPPIAGQWILEHDNHGLGTVALPDPFGPEGASAGGGRACARIHGHLGLNQAPWTWVHLHLGLLPLGTPHDLGGARSLRFWARGDGGLYQVSLVKASITDSDQYSASFTAPARWTLIRLPLDAFHQAGWGRAVPRVFDDVTAVDFAPATHDADFDLSVASVVLDSRPVPPAVVRPVDTRGWWAYPGVDPAARKGTALDLGFLDDAPAGRHGRVRTQGEDFVFDDGSPVRFFGINVVASSNFPTHAQADAMARLLAEMGVNLTRHHHLEAVWSNRNIFGSDTQTLRRDPESMDRFDYLVAALQKRGIYQYFDLLVSRHPLAADGVADPADLADGWKIMAEFAPDLLRLERGFITAFLGHRNRYTGRRYADDPGVAMVDIINEDSLFYRGSSGDFSARGAYAGVLQGLFNAWLRAHYPDRAALLRAWAPQAPGQRGLGPDEDPWARTPTARPLASWQDDSWSSLSPARARDEERFNYDTQTGYYRSIITLLRTLGYRGLVTGSNHWTSSPGDLLANASLGTYIDRHAYFAHPQGGWGYVPAVSFDPRPMLRTPGLGVVGELAQRRVRGLPFIAGEWQCAAPNRYRADAVLDMAAACDLQDWSAVQFAFLHSNQGDLRRFAGPLDNNFNVANQPAMLALWPAAAMLARRGDLGPAPASGFTPMTRDAALWPGTSLPDPGRAVLSEECGVDFDPAPGAPGPGPAVVRGAYSVGDGGAVRHDPTRGVLLIDTAGTQAEAGFLSALADHPSGLRAEVRNPYAVVVATALDTNRLDSARKVLLSAVADAVNTGQAYTAAGDQLARPGTAPVLVEPVVGRVWVRLPRTRRARVWALDPSGRRRGPAVFERVADGLWIRLRAADRALNYEIDLPDAGAF